MIFTALSSASSNVPERVIKITAHRFAYQPATINVKKDESVILEMTSLDVIHGFNLFAFGIRQDLLPGETVRIHFIAHRTGTFPFACDIFCGTGHEDMNGMLIVTE